MTDRRLWMAVTLALCAAAPATAQSGAGGDVPVVFPEVTYFRDLFADPHDPRFSVALIRTNLFESKGPERPAYVRSPGNGAEVQAAVAIGTTFPVFHVARIEGGGITIGAQAAVFARFRIEQPSRDDLGQDWFVGMPIDASWGESSMRLRLIHQSSHLGDEFSESTGGERIEYGGEALDVLFARELGAFRAYGGAGWIIHSNTDDTSVLRELDRSDRYTAQAGLDGEWRPFDDRRLSIRGGADWQSAQRTGWRPMWSVAGGFNADLGRGEAALLVRYTAGRSALGQFFLTAERVWSLEIVLGGG